MSSQFGQDEWVIRTLQGMRNGVFLDIGAGDPVQGSNTVRLERDFDWLGVLCDIETHDALREQRVSDVHGDAFAVNWHDKCLRIARNGRIDYLSLDLEPPPLTLLALTLLPLSEVRFTVATIEHDAYRDNGTIRAAMRAIMLHHGYTLMAADRGMTINGQSLAIDDWWVDTTAPAFKHHEAP
jgi:hypothetical protein